MSVCIYDVLLAVFMVCVRTCVAWLMAFFVFRVQPPARMYIYIVPLLRIPLIIFYSVYRSGFKGIIKRLIPITL